MKKIISLLLIATIGISLVGCGSKAADKKDDTAKNETKTEAPKTEEPKKEEVQEPEVFADFAHLLNSYANKDNYFNLINTIKLNKKDKEKEYKETATTKLNETLASKQIDASKAKIYPYYQNLNGAKAQLTYVITYGDDKKATKVYEVYDTISNDYEITPKEVKENDEILKNAQFEKLFAKEFEEKTEE